MYSGIFESTWIYLFVHRNLFPVGFSWKWRRWLIEHKGWKKRDGKVSTWNKKHWKKERTTPDTSYVFTFLPRMLPQCRTRNLCTSPHFILIISSIIQQNLSFLSALHPLIFFLLISFIPYIFHYNYPQLLKLFFLRRLFLSISSTNGNKTIATWKHSPFVSVRTELSCDLNC